MTKYLLGRILRSLVSIFIVVGVIMVMIYTFLDKKAVFASDPSFTKVTANSREEYMMKQWENYGYLDFIPYADYLTEELKAGNINQETYDDAAKESGEQIVSRPQIDVTQIEEGKPFIYTAEAAKRPDVKLGKYKGVTVTKVDTTVTDAEVDEAVENERNRNGRSITDENRIIENGDYMLLVIADNADDIETAFSDVFRKMK